MHNFKKIISPVLFIAVIICINEILIFATKPYSFFRNDMHHLQEEEYSDIFVGTSHGKAGIKPIVVDEITGGNSINLCLGGEFVADSYYVVKEAVRIGNPKRVVYELDPGYWVTEDYLGPEFLEIYSEFSMSMVKLEYFFGEIWDKDWRIGLFPWYLYRNGFKNAVSRVESKLGKAYRDYEDTFFDNPAQSYGGKGNVSIHRSDATKTEDNLALWEESKLNEKTVKDFEKLHEFCEKQGIEMIVIISPIPQETYEKYKDNFDSAYAFFSEFMEKRGIVFYNYNKIDIEGFDMTLNGFCDYEGHMYEDQAEVFSRELGNMMLGQSTGKRDK